MAKPWERYGAPAEQPAEPAQGAKPWEKYGTVSPVTQQQMASGEAQVGREQMSHASALAQSLARGEEPAVDYRTGVPNAKLTAELSLLTKSEQKQLLDKRFGAENVDTDAFGNWILKPGGYEKAGIPAEPRGSQTRGTAVIPKERWTLPRAASFAGEVLPTAGAAIGGMYGGAAGAPAGPGGVTAGAMGGAALGGGAGEAGNALIAQALGLADRSVGEQQKMIAMGMLGGAAGEGAGRLLGRAGRAFVGPYAEFAPSSPEHLANLRRALDMGLVPRMGAAQPKSFLMPREQGLVEAVFGFGPEKKNAEILRREGEKLVAGTGGKTTATGRDVISATQQRLGELSQEFDAAHKNASKMVDDSIQQLQNRIGKAAPMDVQKDIEASYKAAQNEATGLYNEVDKLVGNRPAVPTSPVRQAAKDILDGLPKDRNGAPLYDPDGVAIKFLRGMTQLPEMYTMRDMQALRSQLASSAEVRSLLASTGARNAEILRQATNDAFDQVGQAMRGERGRFIAGQSPNAKAAVEALNKADKFYSGMMDKFDVPLIRKLTLDARESGHVAPEKILDVIAMPNAATNVAKIMSVVTPETRNAIRRAHFDSMLEKSSDALTGQISGVKLAQEIKRLRSTFPALYGRDAQSIATLANQLAALDGKVDVAALQSGNIATAIKKAIDAEKAFKTISDDELFAQLAKPGFESATTVDHLFRPGHPERISRAIKFFGEDSPEVKNIRAMAMMKLMQSMEFTEATRTGVKHGISGKQLEDVLKLYGRPTVEAMFGKEQTRNLYEFASAAELATAKNPQLSKIAAAAVVLHPVSHVRTLADLAVGGKLMTSPKFIKWMTEGFKYGKDGNMVKAMNAFTRAAAYRQAIQAEQPGIGGDTLVDKELAAARAAVVPDEGQAPQTVQSGAQQ